LANNCNDLVELRKETDKTVLILVCVHYSIIESDHKIIVNL